MTAIAGLIATADRRIDASVIERMVNALRCYGQDSADSKCASDRGMVRCLLKTTAEESFDIQPMTDGRNGLWMVFDGRLDNRRELARELRLSSKDLDQMPDSLLAFQCVRELGEASVERFEGDFAIACFDKSRSLIWLARDPLGTRPLFWCTHDGLIGFSSMPKALFCIPGMAKEIDRASLHDYLCLLPMHGSSTFFKGVHKVEPGQIVSFRKGEKRTRKYHKFEYVKQLNLSSDDEYLEAFSEHLEEAVACRLRSNCWIGSHLSSGLDSSTITAIAAEQLAAKNKTLAAFTAVPREGFSGKVPAGHHGNEGHGAREVAARFSNVEHILIHTSRGSLKNGFDLDVERLDRAPLNACNRTWVRAIEEEAQRRGIKILLTGRLGNFSISYQGWQYLPSLFRRGKLITWWKECSDVLRQFPRFGRRRLLECTFNPLLPKTLWRFQQRVKGQSRNIYRDSALNAGLFSNSSLQRRAAAKGWDLSYQPWADGREMRMAALSRFDLGEYSLSANALNVEMRSPAMDRRLIEFCLAVPDNQYFRHGRPGWLLERLMRTTLPENFFGMPTKGLQFADWYEQFDLALPEIRRDLEKLASNAVAREVLDLDGLTESLDSWDTVEAGSLEQEQIFRLRLLRGLSIGAFIRYTEGENE